MSGLGTGKTWGSRSALTFSNPSNTPGSPRLEYSQIDFVVSEDIEGPCKLGVGVQQKADLVAFMNALTGEVTDAPPPAALPQ